MDNLEFKPVIEMSEEELNDFRKQNKISLLSDKSPKSKSKTRIIKSVIRTGYHGRRHEEVAYLCDFCGGERTMKAYDFNNNVTHYCGKKCRNLSRSRKKITHRTIKS